MATYYELVKQSLMQGLRRANYDIKRFQPAPIRAGFFADRIEITNAEHSARSIVQRINIRAEKGEAMTRDNLEKLIAMESAQSAFYSAHGNIAISLALGKNVSKYVQEAREALTVLKQYPESGATFLEQSFKQLVGEE